jgi:3-methyl-2-oxobutanoate hydroxymethyltransferase
VEGGYTIKGRTPESAEALLADARALEKAGAFAIVLELVTPPVAERISRELQIPTIGIGAGPHCDGQVLVVHDLLGLFPWFTPKFVQPEAQLSYDVRAAVGRYIEATKRRRPA